jgi:anti-sigma factor RsiW
MQCSAPPPLTDEQISTVIDGTAAPAVHAHVSQCASCAQRLAQARGMEQSLRTRLYRWDCPSPQQLADYQVRRANPSEARAIAAHLAGCVRCTEELAELQQFLAADVPLEAPQPAPMPPKTSPWGALFARPQPQRPAVALRGAGPGPLMAAVGDTTIFLDVQPAAGQIALQGQLVDADQDRWVGALVEIRQSGALVATAEVGDLGGFTCAALPVGATELRITPRHGRMIVLTDLDLKPNA